MSTTTMTTSETSLSTLLSTPMSEPIPSSTLIPYLSASPWHQIPGTFNFRSVPRTPYVKENFIYRSGMLSYLSEEGKKMIAESLGIKAIFDLRFKEESVADPEPKIAGVENVGVEIEDGGRVAEEVEWKSLVQMYVSILASHRIIFRTIFLHVLQNPDQPFLVHCTAGKDRTGVAIALLLSLAGVPLDIIAHDYALTRIGIEPVRELLQAKLVGEEGKEMDWNSELLKTLAGCEAQTVLGFLEEVGNRYEGGVEGFMVTDLGFSTQEVKTIQANLKGSCA